MIDSSQWSTNCDEALSTSAAPRSCPVSWRRKTLILLGEENPKGRQTILSKGIGLLIIFSIALAVLETEPAIKPQHLWLLRSLDTFVNVLFLIEYLLRLWISPLKPGNSKGISGAIRWALSPTALVDLVSISPILLRMIAPHFYTLRIVRIIRLMRIGRLGRSDIFTKSIARFHSAIASKTTELTISSAYTSIVIFISSISMYIAEGDVQEDQFGSVLRCLWWSVITVTTIGYGDVYPVTPVGRLIASVTALLGIAVVAVPIGILSSAFLEESKKKEET